jgi:hypothetical protein
VVYTTEGVLMETFDLAIGAAAGAAGVIVVGGISYLIITRKIESLPEALEKKISSLEKEKKFDEAAKLLFEFVYKTNRTITEKFLAELRGRFNKNVLAVIAAPPKPAAGLGGIGQGVMDFLAQFGIGQEELSVIRAESSKVVKDAINSIKVKAPAAAPAAEAPQKKKAS